MARYDRIARLDSPERDDAFTGWLMVRDLENRERDADLGRRARLRFLAMRLLDRIVRRGSEIDGDSIQQQANAVREELGQLPSRDPDRERLATLLEHVAGGDMKAAVESTLDMAEAARGDGHPYAAEEWYRTALSLARGQGLDALAASASAGVAELGSGTASA